MVKWNLPTKVTFLFIFSVKYIFHPKNIKVTKYIKVANSISKFPWWVEWENRIESLPRLLIVEAPSLKQRKKRLRTSVMWSLDISRPIRRAMVLRMSTSLKQMTALAWLPLGKLMLVQDMMSRRGWRNFPKRYWQEKIGMENRKNFTSSCECANPTILIIKEKHCII